MKCGNCKEELVKVIRQTGRFLRCANCDFPAIIPNGVKVEYAASKRDRMVKHV